MWLFASEKALENWIVKLEALQVSIDELIAQNNAGINAHMAEANTEVIAIEVPASFMAPIRSSSAGERACPLAELEQSSWDTKVNCFSTF